MTLPPQPATPRETVQDRRNSSSALHQDPRRRISGRDRERKARNGRAIRASTRGRRANPLLEGDEQVDDRPGHPAPPGKKTGKQDVVASRCAFGTTREKNYLSKALSNFIRLSVVPWVFGLCRHDVHETPSRVDIIMICCEKSYFCTTQMQCSRQSLRPNGAST